MSINLMQVQSSLRGLPAADPRSMQMLTAYANGQDPGVPPFLALAELNYRKQMQQKKAQPPEQTVKDKIEQEARMMQTNAGRQQEAMQKMGQQAMTANTGKIPSSTPATMPLGEEEDGMAEGGIARLNSDFNFAQGGIVAFAGPTEENNDSSVKDKEETSSTAGDFMKKISNFIAEKQANARAVQENVRNKNEIAQEIQDTKPGLFEQVTPSDRKSRNDRMEVLARYLNQSQPQTAAAQQSAPAPAANPDQPPLNAPPEMTPEQKIQMLMSGRTQGGGGANISRVSGSAPAGGDIYSMMVNQLKGDKFEAGPDYEAFMNAQKAKNPDMQGKAGGKLETLIDEIRRQDLADRAEVKAQEEKRKGNRLLDVFSAAGQGMGRFKQSEQGGGKGILNFLGGVGQNATAMEEADIQRSKEQKALERQQNLAYAEMMGRIEDTRRAEARGDAKEIFAAKNAEAKAKNDYSRARTESLYHGSTVEEQRRHGMASEAIQRQQASAANRDLIRERAAVLAQDPANRGKSPTELMQMAAMLATGVQQENAETARLKAVAAAWKDSPDGMQEKIQSFKPDSKEYKDLMIKKEKFYKNNGVNLNGSGGGSTMDTSQFNVREKGGK
jgi:hypothetical protein